MKTNQIVLVGIIIFLTVIVGVKMGLNTMQESITEEKGARTVCHEKAGRDLLRPEAQELSGTDKVRAYDISYNFCIRQKGY